MRHEKVTPLGISVLALLNERPMHPYEMYQLLVARREDRIVKLRPGSLYHTVDRLAERKLLSATGTGRAGNRPERTIYQITESGRTALTERIADIIGNPVREFPLFPLALAEAHNLEADIVIALVRRRLEWIDSEITELEQLERGATERAVPKMYWLVVGYLRAQAAAEAAWLLDLVDQLSSGAMPWHCANSPTASSLTAEARKQ